MWMNGMGDGESVNWLCSLQKHRSILHIVLYNGFAERFPVLFKCNEEMEILKKNSSGDSPGQFCAFQRNENIYMHMTYLSLLVLWAKVLSHIQKHLQWSCCRCCCLIHGRFLKQMYDHTFHLWLSFILSMDIVCLWRFWKPKLSILFKNIVTSLFECYGYQN